MSWLDYPRAGTGTAAFASDLSPEVLLQWIDRGRLKLGPCDKDSSGSGDARLLSIRRVYQIALTAALNRHGVPVRTAAAMARRFSDEPGEGRAAGELHATGGTWLVQDVPAAARVVNNLPTSTAHVAITVNVSAIVAEVQARLAARGVDLAAA